MSSSMQVLSLNSLRQLLVLVPGLVLCRFYV